jgi:hypothetical protein
MTRADRRVSGDRGAARYGASRRESAALWLAGRNGPVQLTVVKLFFENPAARALEQSELSDPRKPVRCFPTGIEALASSGWDINQYLQDAYWGTWRDGLDRFIAGGNLPRTTNNRVAGLPATLEYPRNWNRKT